MLLAFLVISKRFLLATFHYRLTLNDGYRPGYRQTVFIGYVSLSIDFERWLSSRLSSKLWKWNLPLMVQLILRAKFIIIWSENGYCQQREYYKRSDLKDYINCLRVTFQGHDGTTGDPNFKSYRYVYKSIQKRLFANFFKNNQKPGCLCFILIITKTN